MKNENHTGFCSGHRGFKRKNATGAGEEGTGGQRRKSGRKGKGRGAGAYTDCHTFPLHCSGLVGLILGICSNDCC